MTQRCGAILEHCRGLRLSDAPEVQVTHFQEICDLADQDEDCRTTLASELAASDRLRQVFLTLLKSPTPNQNPQTFNL